MTREHKMPPGISRRGVHGLRIFTGLIVILMAYATFGALERGTYLSAALMGGLCLLNMNGFMNFTKILQANPK